MHRHAGKVQQNVGTCHAAIPSLEKRKQAKPRSISFLIHSYSTSYAASSMTIITLFCLAAHTQKSQ